MGHESGTLRIPDAARQDPKSTEMLRAWVANGGLHCVLRMGVWKDPAARGILLADVVRHVANAHQESDVAVVNDVIQRIRDGFDAELDGPTDEPEGHFS